ncbi:leucine-rich repeat domain-containing protein [Prevotella copri]|uniref:Leucine-rich repeat domain-containing protein n=1 Tax=Segatella copri TaxID=165179 RepID=A0AAP2TPU2_9BACT|nr:leucine-rich repeat domain-containing protein [Segatella copri]MCE4120992.1 leucine-rich repeat domain-containing protein [Segatella copri]MCP9497287.1 leucine-rich repeat domain-containing protein [Segatella copri]MCP9521277.1 leucine-rich repeat domain-containing protein [Segatella copri]MCP9546128.1 leucine-rich repeat domain-containing protein [Segatella copri]MCP9569237.1 leucine-rich repeat domain-containing protein [Segatella copri]
MRNFTLRKGFLESKCGTHSSFKGFVMLVVMMLMMASSAMAEVIDGLRYMLDSDTKTAMLLPKKDGKYSGDIVVPEKVKGNDGVEYVVTSLGNECFSYCSGLTSVNIPSSVTSLSYACFKGCSGLTSVNIPSSVTSLGSGCFEGCSGLTSVSIPSSVTSLGRSCFWNCSGLTSVSIPSSVTSLGDDCFYYCSSLSSITIPSSVTSLGNSCFSGCSGLTSVTIPSSVTSLGNSCFSGCSGLTSATIPSSVTSLGNYCFSDCSGLTSVTIPSSVTSLGVCCFSSCSGLTSITIPSSVTSLGSGCFWNCSGLTSVSIPSSVTSLGDDCFSGCSGLTSITIPSSVTYVGSDCFSGCSGLTSITIPSSVTYVGSDCFIGCDNIETVYFKGKYCNSSYTDLHIPKTSIIKVPTEYLQDYKDAFGFSYKYIYAWNPSESGDDTKPVTPCATPSISYESGKLKFACETAGAKYHYTISDKDMATDALSEDGNVFLSAAYDISVYATADGYKASDKAEATLYWINANLDNGTNINQVRTRGVVASAHDGIISLSGLDDGEVVKFFAADGKYLGSTVAANGAASYAVSESLVIAKVGKDSIKIAMK